MAFNWQRAEWPELATSAPMLTGGTVDLVASLASVLEHASGGVASLFLPDVDAINRVQKQIGVLGLTARTVDGLELTELGRQWLAGQDPIDLFLIFHSRLAYIGEMLAHLADGPARVDELLAHACDEYRMSWRTPDQIRRRLAWFRAFGLVSEGANRVHWITDLGRQVLARIDVAAPDEILRVVAIEPGEGIPPPPPLLGEAIAAASGESREISIGYLTKNPDQEILTLVKAASGGVARDELVEDISQRLSISTTSASMFLWTVRRMGLLEYTGKEEISPTELGTVWPSFASPLNLVRLMHARFLVVGEVLLHVADKPRSTAEIHRATFEEDARALPRSRTAQILRRLCAAGAVAHIGHARYVITPIGRALIDELPMLEIGRDDCTRGCTANRTDTKRGPTALREQLLAASRDSAHPERFERVCAAAFRALGVDASHLGGPGRTDVLVNITGNLTHLATAIIDAKSSTGRLAEGSVKFEALKEHAIQHGADLMAIVAPAYTGSGRLPEWAEKYGVVLFTALELADLVEAHDIIPFTPEDVKALLTVGQRHTVEDRRRDFDASLSLIQDVLSELQLEAEQDAPEPISARDIARAMRRGKRPASEEEVKDVLRFLADPHIGAVHDAGVGRYALPASLGVPARRLQALARAITAIPSGRGHDESPGSGS